MCFMTPNRLRCGKASTISVVVRGDIIGYLPQAHALNVDFPISVRQLARLGLAGKTGSFVAAEWSEAEKQQNPLRRSPLQAGTVPGKNQRKIA